MRMPETIVNGIFNIHLERPSWPLHSCNCYIHLLFPYIAFILNFIVQGVSEDEQRFFFIQHEKFPLVGPPSRRHHLSIA